MKKRFLNYAMKTLKSQYPDLTDTKLEELEYGLEGTYLTITKLIVIIALALILNIFKEVVIMLFIFNILRTTGFGLHATKSWICLLSSGITFIVFPLLSKFIVIPLVLKVILGIISIVCIFLYTPADTKKRPIINKTRRNRYRFITTINCIILVFISLFIPDSYSNLILFGIYSEVIIILPITYHLFNLSYDNYKNYLVLNTESV